MNEIKLLLLKLRRLLRSRGRNPDDADDRGGPIAGGDCDRGDGRDPAQHLEALFRTAKYRPQFLALGFASIEDARRWASEFVAWYNHEHRHSGIRFVSPAQRHDGDILARRHVLYINGQAANPRRWARHTRNWQPIAAVTLNPERESVVNAALAREKDTASAA